MALDNEIMDYLKNNNVKMKTKKPILKRKKIAENHAPIIEETAGIPHNVFTASLLIFINIHKTQ